MKTCHLSDFMQSIKPWLSDDYIQQAHLDKEGRVVLLFKDGVQNVYRIDDCNKNDLIEILKDLQEKGIPILLPG
jgi:hypothetical protein